MVYDVEFIRRIDGQAEALALDVVRLIADGLAGVIAHAEDLYRKVDTVPRPDGFRIREGDGAIVHEFYEAPNT
jgi:hypothetical protein